MVTLNTESEQRMTNITFQVERSIAYQVRMNSIAAGRLQLTEPAVAKSFGDGQIALVFSDGSELDFPILQFEDGTAFWTPARESEYSLSAGAV